MFYQGTGFDGEKQAQRIADLINNDPDFPWKDDK